MLYFGCFTVVLWFDHVLMLTCTLLYGYDILSTHMQAPNCVWMNSDPGVGIPLFLEARRWFLQVTTRMSAMLPPPLCNPSGQKKEP